MAAYSPPQKARATAARQDLTSAHLDQLNRALGPSRRAVATECLHGGLTARVDSIQLADGTEIVLKRYESPDAVARELLGLRAATLTPITTPAPLLADLDGSMIGCPVLAMTRVRGSTTSRPSTTRIRTLAHALAAIHATPIVGAVSKLPRQPPLRRWNDNDLRRLRDPALCASLRERSETMRTDAPSGLLHHDVHLRNVTWVDDELTGIVDWNEACLGPSVSDVAYCSVDLAMCAGVDAARQLTTHYLETTGEVLEDLVPWQAYWALNGLAWIHSVAESISSTDSGRDVDPARLEDRLLRFSRQLLR